MALAVLTAMLTFCVSATASETVKTNTENVPLYNSNGGKIGILKKPVNLRVLRQSGYMFLVEYSDDNLTLVGWVAKAQCISAAAAVDETAKTAGVSKPAPAGGGTDQITGAAKETKRLTAIETRKKLRDILKVPVNYIQQTEVDSKKGGQGSSTQTEASKLYMRLNPTDKNADGYAEITVLVQFDRDSIVTFFVNQKITTLEEFQQEAAEDYSQIIGCYVEALEKYNDDLRGNFLSLCNRATKYERLLKDM